MVLVRRARRVPLNFVLACTLDLVSDEATYVTGECIRVSGGTVLLGPAGLMPRG